jgi:hypothetical protein
VGAAAGAGGADACGRDLHTLGHRTRRTPVAAGSAALLDELLALRTERGDRPSSSPR